MVVISHVEISCRVYEYSSIDGSCAPSGDGHGFEVRNPSLREVLHLDVAAKCGGDRQVASCVRYMGQECHRCLEVTASDAANQTTNTNINKVCHAQSMDRTYKTDMSNTIERVALTWTFWR